MSNLVPEIAVPDAKAEIKFIEEVFGAKLGEFYPHEDKVMHSNVSIDDGRKGSVFVVSIFDGTNSPKVVPTVSTSDEECAQIVARMLAEGSTELMKFELQFWGSKYGRYRDPFGFEWAISGPRNLSLATPMPDFGQPGSPAKTHATTAAAESVKPAVETPTAPPLIPLTDVGNVPAYKIVGEKYTNIPASDRDAQISSACSMAAKVAHAAGISVVPGVQVVQYTSINFEVEPALFTFIAGVPIDPHAKTPFVKTHNVGGEEGCGFLTSSSDRDSLGRNWGDLMRKIKESGADESAPYYEITHGGKTDIYSIVLQQKRSSKRARKN